MPLHHEEQRRLLEALVALECGDSSTFCDVLWLTFGSEWTQMRDLLRDAGFVRYTGADSVLPVITDRGLNLIASLFNEVGSPKPAPVRTLIRDAV